MLLLAAFNSARFVRSFSPEFMLGAGGGLVQGVGLILMGTFSFYRHEPGALWSFLLIPCAAACFLASFVSMQSGVQVGRAMIVITLNTVVTNLVAITGGVFVLGETLPTDPFRAGLEIPAFAAIVVASGILAHLGAPGTVGEPADAVSRPTAVARGV